jgi:hypothetical protein
MLFVSSTLSDDQVRGFAMTSSKLRCRHLGSKMVLCVVNTELWEQRHNSENTRIIIVIVSCLYNMPMTVSRHHRSTTQIQIGLPRFIPFDVNTLIAKMAAPRHMTPRATHLLFLCK